MDEHARGSGWLVAIWNSLRFWFQQRLFTWRTGGVLAALMAGVALIVGVLAYGNLQRPTASGETGAGVAPQSTASAGVDLNTLTAGATARGPIYPAAAPSEGRRLAGHKQLMLAPTARTQLTTGKVDRRVTAVLDWLLARHMIQVTTFGPAEPGIPLRVITIDCIDELPVKAESPETVSVLEFFDQLRPPLAPESMRLAKQGKATVIVVTYPVAVR
jgi:hypothetical protein